VKEKGYFTMNDGRKSTDVPYHFIKRIGDLHRKNIMKAVSVNP
jgi:hypothetical protein